MSGSFNYPASNHRSTYMYVIVLDMVVLIWLCAVFLNAKI